jgi:uncharacterized protein with PIN domain/molybdopterin converting factor small subunit
MNHVTVRVYGSLNDFLPAAQRQAPIPASFAGARSVKDLVESLGVPHPEIELIVVNGESAPFDRPVQDGDRVAVFPRFHSLDVAPISRVAPDPPVRIAFVLDGHLGTLARRLRMVGVDAAYSSSATDDELAARAAREGRILLTRDRGLLNRRIVVYGYWVRETDPDRQLVDVLRHFGPLALRPLTRCLRCNADLRDVPKAAVETRLPALTGAHYDRFQECSGCRRVYWQGAHWQGLVQSVERALEAAGSAAPPTLVSGGRDDRRRSF